MGVCSNGYAPTLVTMTLATLATEWLLLFRCESTPFALSGKRVYEVNFDHGCEDCE